MDAESVPAGAHPRVAPPLREDGQVRVLIFHGYLLRGTGSNVYNARLARALARNGHEVHLLCQERHPEDLGFIDASGDWTTGELVVRDLDGGDEGGGSITVYRPDIGDLLPVYVADRYEGLRAKTFLELTESELDDYLARNVAAVAEVAARVDPGMALANHLVPGPAIVARALGDAVPTVVKVHGSDLEYAVKRDRSRYVPLALEGVRDARAVLVGSLHTAESLWEAVDDPHVRLRTRLGPPGVDIEQFRPRGEDDGPARVADLVRTLERSAENEAGREAPPASAFTRDVAEAARAVAELDVVRDRHVVFVGKLIVSKGIDLLVAAWPLVLAQVPDARLVIVGFGAYRPALERLLDALARGDMEDVRELARQGRGAEGGPVAPLSYLLAFLADLEAAPDRAAYLDSAQRLRERIVLTGRLEHEEIAPLLAVAEAEVVPSTFPEAFGMVAAEAAACGALPVSAAHSGLAEVSAVLSERVPPEAAPWLSFDLGPHAVRDLAHCLIAWMNADPSLRAATREALVAVAQERFSWDGVASDLITAGTGALEGLARP
jgi:glycosyltransferase involved in cell wall biosynthesis